MHPVTREITAAGARLTRGGHLRGALSAARAAPRRASASSPASMRCWCRRRRPPTRPRRCWPIRSSSTAGSAPTPISSICSTSAASRCRRAMRTDGIPFGVTLLAPAGQRRAARQHRPRVPCRHGTADGRTGMPQPPLAPLAGRRCTATKSRIAVVGAHLSGMPLNGELKALGGALARGDRDRAGLPALCAGRPRRRSPACCASSRRRARRSSSKSGRCRRRRSADSSPRSRRRSRSARCGSPTAAA